MNVLIFNLRALGPVLAASLQGDPNSAITFPYIPGSLIRGALINRYLAQQHVTTTELATHPETRALFFSGQTRYLPAYLHIKGQRSLPTPFSLYHEKPKKDDFTAYNKAHPDFAEEDGFAELKQPKQLEQTFGYLSSDTLIYKDLDTQISIHTQRERRAGRALEGEDSGAVFRYEALATGQVFTALILADDNQQLDQLGKLLEGSLTFGGSRSAGYGRMQIEDVRRMADWTETEPVPGINAGNKFTVTLVSDTILRDDNGQYLDTLLPTVLVETLNLPAGSLKAGPVFKHTYLVGGFNRKWGLPLPQMMALQAGSVFGFETSHDIPTEQLKALQWQGIGERRTEGFGRVAINWPNCEELFVQKYEDKAPAGSAPVLATKLSQELARLMDRRLLRRDADRALNKTINQIKISHSPKKSQLGSVRISIRQALHQGNMTLLLEHLEGMSGKVAGKQFEQGRIGRNRDSLLDWLENRAKEPDKIWGQISFQPNQAKHINPEPVQADAALELEYTLRLIDGILAKAAKEGSDD